MKLRFIILSGAGGAAIAGKIINTATQAGLGIAQLIKAKKAKREAEAKAPELRDQRQLSISNRLERKSRAYQSGSDYSNNLGKISEASASMSDSIKSVSGGAGGAALAALIQSRGAVASATNQALAQSEQVGITYNQMNIDTARRIEQRELELRAYAEDRLRGEAAQLKKAGIENVTGAITGIGDSLQGPMGGKTELDSGIKTDEGDSNRDGKSSDKSGVGQIDIESIGGMIGG